MTQHLHGEERQQLLTDARNLYALGLTIQQVADQLGYSKSATRHNLLAAGITLRPKYTYTPRTYPAGNPLEVDCPKCGATPHQHCQVGYGRQARRTHEARRRKAPDA